jgi:hypothetical protein
VKWDRDESRFWRVEPLGSPCGGHSFRYPSIMGRTEVRRNKIYGYETITYACLQRYVLQVRNYAPLSRLCHLPPSPQWRDDGGRRLNIWIGRRERVELVLIEKHNRAAATGQKACLIAGVVTLQDGDSMESIEAAHTAAATRGCLYLRCSLRNPKKLRAPVSIQCRRGMATV